MAEEAFASAVSSALASLGRAQDTGQKRKPGDDKDIIYVYLQMVGGERDSLSEGDGELSRFRREWTRELELHMLHGASEGEETDFASLQSLVGKLVDLRTLVTAWSSTCSSPRTSCVRSRPTRAG
jgi:hypothetical protein